MYSIDNRIKAIETKLTQMRLDYKQGSPAMKAYLAQKAKTLNSELSLLERILTKRKTQTSLLDNSSD